MPTPTAAIEVQIADALAAGITAAYFSDPYRRITAIRRDVPDYEGPELKTLQVSVVSPSDEMEPARQGDMFTYATTVVLARHVANQTQIDDLRRLRQEIVDAIRSGVINIQAVSEDLRFVRAYTQTAFDRDALSDRRVMLASIAIEHKMIRGWVQPTGPTGA
jgi:hypothetical protein